MPSLPRRHASWRALAASTTLLLAATLAACGQDEPADTAPSSTASEPESESPSASPTTAEPSPTEATSSTPSESAEPTEPTPSEAESPATLADALLGAGDVPGLNAESSWTQGRTGAVGTNPFGWCAKFDGLTIGAREGVQRQFRSGDDRAAQQVLDFVDATNALRAERVLRSWHRDCRGGSEVERRPVQDVAAGSGTAWWYLSSRDRDGGEWESLGVARSGNLVTVLRMQHAGQDHSYPPGEDPLEQALVAAAAKLG